MNANTLPGFTAERSLDHHHLNYSQRLRPIAGGHGIRPQFIKRIICEALFRNCFLPTDAACSAWLNLCTPSEDAPLGE